MVMTGRRRRLHGPGHHTEGKLCIKMTGGFLGACISLLPQTERTWKRHQSFLGCPDGDHSNLSQTTCGPIMAKLHLQQNFSNEFRPLQLLSVAPPWQCQGAGRFFAEFSAGKTDHFFGGKRSSTTRGSVTFLP